MSVAQVPQWTLGNRLWRARIEAELDQDQIAVAVGVSRAQVSKWERDQAEPRPSQIRRIAEVTNVPFRWLVDDEFVSSLWTTEHPDHPLLAATA